ncbi:MAG: hypothetical protein JW940_24675, partial [Polyangiaceae bacterium]|nr:hypothetical protein [Polyangiaceae bacterium]
DPSDNAVCTGEWNCALDYYGDGADCDCGCGFFDPDCASSSPDACEYCADTGSCGVPDCANVDPSDNAVCTGEWNCALEYYGDGADCDCGCGFLDPDCASSSSDACKYCADTGSCGASDCSNIDPSNNAVCI